jgi:hypothetical protein
MFSGIIIETFGSLREQAEMQNDDKMNCCFICSVRKVDFKRRNIDFEKHKSNDHLVEDYMKVLLCQDVEKLGWLGDTVEVKEGFARNYLLPQRVAIAATDANVKALAAEKAKRAERKGDYSAALASVDQALAAKNTAAGMNFGSGLYGGSINSMRTIDGIAIYIPASNHP